MNATRKREPARSGDEQDVIGKGRHSYCYTARAGVTDSVKRALRRRERQVGKTEARKDTE